MACRRTLMCKNHPVVEFIYDEEIHAVTKITGVPGREFAPVALFAPDSGHPITRRTLNDWWTGRAIPFTRDDMHRLKEGLGISSTMELLERGMGLSLSDRYWVKEMGDPRGWSDVNFFDNPFGDELGRLTLGQTSSATLERSPNASLGGDLRKMWTVENGRRGLLKAGRGRANQEPYNEVIATELYQRVLEPGDFVPYDIEERGGVAYSRCPNMLGPNEELVPAWELRQCQPHPKNETLYARWIRTLRGLGLEGQLECADTMLVCDYIIGNFDRHWNNFGLIRDTETREFKRVAPIFDSGNSLWCSTPRLDCPADCLYDLLPFLDREKNAARMFALLGDLSWLDPARLEGFDEFVHEALSNGPNLDAAFIDAVTREVGRRIRIVGDQWLRRRQHV